MGVLMKKLLFVFIFVLLTSTLFALDGKVGFGWQDKSENGYQHGPFYMRMDLAQELGISTFSGGCTIEMSNKPDTSFPSVSQGFYSVGWSLNLDPFTMTIGHDGTFMSDTPAEFGYTKIEICINGHL
jgi:hypothetical protein